MIMCDKISQNDFDFYKQLPDADKVLFVYDWLFYELDEELIPTVEKLSINDLIDILFKSDADANVIVANNQIIINSDLQKHIRLIANSFSMQGLIIQLRILPDKIQQLFQRQKYCVSYDILGTVPPICLS